jgi:hypothetical protein
VTTRCDDFQARVDLIAMGGALGDAALSNAATPSDADAAHLESCMTCREVLRRARAVEAALAARPTPELASGFTAKVMIAVQRERWRAEQALDLGFNLAVAGGLLLVVAGLVGLAWRTGLIVIGGDLATLATAGVTVLASRVGPQLPNVMLAALLLTMALGVWWWAEGIEV